MRCRGRRRRRKEAKLKARVTRNLTKRPRKTLSKRKGISQKREIHLIRMMMRRIPTYLRMMTRRGKMMKKTNKIAARMRGLTKITQKVKRSQAATM